MSAIEKHDFEAMYGVGHGPVAGSPNYTPEHDIRVITALVDTFRPRRVLEIGCNVGATAAAILDGNKSIIEYVGLELSAMWFDAGKKAGELVTDERFKLVQLDVGSRDLDPDSLEPFDLIFIDGAHDYESVKFDTELSRKLLAPAGVLIWHDYNHPRNPDVMKYIHEVNAADTIVHVKKTWLCYEIIKSAEKASKKNANDKKRPTKKRDVLAEQGKTEGQV